MFYRQHSRPDWKIKRSNSGLFFLVVIALVAAALSNVFRQDEGVLLLPVLLVIALMIATMSFRKGFNRYRK